MDKETLSNYGWIVILMLILAVMIALATPFGNFIAGAIKSTTAGFFSVNQNAMNAGGITILGQHFDDTSTDDTVATLGCDTLYWDGNTDGLDNISGGAYKASSIVPAIEDFANGAAIKAFAQGGQEAEGSIDNIEETNGGYVVAVGGIPVVLVATSDQEKKTVKEFPLTYISSTRMVFLLEL